MKEAGSCPSEVCPPPVVPGRCCGHFRQEEEEEEEAVPKIPLSSQTPLSPVSSYRNSGTRLEAHCQRLKELVVEFYGVNQGSVV